MKGCEVNKSVVSELVYKAGLMTPSERRLLRIAAGFSTQNRLAKYLGVSVDVISWIERGRVKSRTVSRFYDMILRLVACKRAGIEYYLLAHTPNGPST